VAQQSTQLVDEPGDPRLAELGDSGRPIWITEFGWPLADGVDDRLRASYIRKAVQMVRGWPYVKALIVYQEADEGFGLWQGDQPGETWWAYVDEVSNRLAVTVAEHGLKAWHYKKEVDDEDKVAHPAGTVAYYMAATPSNSTSTLG